MGIRGELLSIFIEYEETFVTLSDYAKFSSYLVKSGTRRSVTFVTDKVSS